MNYCEMLTTLSPATALPPPGEWLDEIDSSMSYHGGYMDYDDERVEFENTNCSRCGEIIGPYLAEVEGDYGTVECSVWKECYAWGQILYCEGCTGDLDPMPLYWAQWGTYSCPTCKVWQCNQHERTQPT